LTFEVACKAFALKLDTQATFHYIFVTCIKNLSLNKKTGGLNMRKILSNLMIILFLLLFCFSGCYQMGRAVGKAEHGIKKAERNIEKAGKNFEKGYEKEK